MSDLPAIPTVTVRVRVIVYQDLSIGGWRWYADEAGDPGPSGVAVWLQAEVPVGPQALPTTVIPV